VGEGASVVVSPAPRRQRQFAENPPKKYEDIYPLDFDTTDREGSGTRFAMSSPSGRARAWRCSASTTRTRNPSRSGNG
jgi:hypothetical protein